MRIQYNLKQCFNSFIKPSMGRTLKLKGEIGRKDGEKTENFHVVKN